MDFKQFHMQAWSDHANHPSVIAERIHEGAAIAETDDQLTQLVALITHVFGEHLARWSDGINTLESLRKLSAFSSDGEAARAITRSIASLELASGARASVADLSASDQARAWAVAASALAEQKRTADASAFLENALNAADGLPKEDPANRALAVTGNNLACALEEKPDRSAGETALMVSAAQTARHFWEIAGTWLQVERAEYRLSRSFLKAGRVDEALAHAKACLQLCESNDASALEFFFAYESLALVEADRHSSGGLSKSVQEAKTFFDKLTPDEKSWCLATLETLEKLCATSSALHLPH